MNTPAAFQHERAEIERIELEAAKIRAETEKLKAETERIQQAEIHKMVAETIKIQAESRWYPLVAGAAFAAALIALTKLFL